MTSDFLLRLIRYLLIFIVIASPVVFTDVVDSYYEFPKRSLFTFLIGITFLVMAVVYLRKRVEWLVTRLDVGVLIFLFSTALVSFFSQAPFKSFLGSYGGETPTFLWSLILFFWYGVVRWHQIKFKDLKLWYVPFLSAGIISLVYIAKQALLETDLPRIFFLPVTLSGNQQSTSHLGIYLTILILMGISYQRFTKQRFPLLILIALAAVALILTLSKNAWISAFAGVLVFMKLQNISLGELKGKVFGNRLIFSLSLIGSFVFGLVGYERIKSIFALAPLNNSTVIRAQELLSAAKVFAEYPLIGFGPGLAVSYLQKYRWAELANHPIESFAFSATVHNLYVELLSSGGVIQLGSFLLVLYLAYKVIRKLYSRGKMDPLLAGLISVFAALATFYLAYSYTFVSAFFLWLILGVLSSFDRPILKLKIPPLFLSFGLFLLGLVLIIWTVRAFWGNVVYTQALKSTAIFNKSQVDPNFKATQDLLEKAIAIDPWNNTYYKVEGRVLVVQLATISQDTKVDPVMLREYQLAQKRLLKADTLNSTDPETASLLGNLYFIGARYNKSEDSYEETLKFARKALEMAPTNPEHWNLLGLIELDRGNLVSAEEMFKEVVKIKPNHNQAHYHLGEVLKQQGRFTESIKAYEEVFKYAPGDSFTRSEIDRVKLIEASESSKLQ